MKERGALSALQLWDAQSSCRFKILAPIHQQCGQHYVTWTERGAGSEVCQVRLLVDTRRLLRLGLGLDADTLSLNQLGGGPRVVSGGCGAAGGDGGGSRARSWGHRSDGDP